MENDDLGIAFRSFRLKRILMHWHEARGSRLMPAWREIRPAKIKSELPIVWSYRYDAVQGDFFGGIAGDAIQRLIGGPIKNSRFRLVNNADPHFFARAKQVLTRPSIFLGRGLLFRQRDRQCYGERLILPFADGDGRAGGIFGATDYKFAPLYISGPESYGEVEHWFDLTIPARSLSIKPSESARQLISGTAEAP